MFHDLEAGAGTTVIAMKVLSRCHVRREITSRHNRNDYAFILVTRDRNRVMSNSRHSEGDHVWGYCLEFRAKTTELLNRNNSNSAIYIVLVTSRFHPRRELPHLH